MTKHTHKT